MSLPTFYFDGFSVRPAMEKDRAYIDRLTSADPYHVGRMDADWFLKLAPGEDAWAVEDALGNVILYFKTQTAVRLSIQFGEQGALANREALQKGMRWLEAMLIQNHFREIIFDTKGPALAAMAKRRLGFTEEAPGTLHRVLDTPASARPVDGHWHHEPTVLQGEG